LGNLEAKRDWGHAREYTKAMWMMLQKEIPNDYVIASGETHTVREFLKIAFSYVGLNYEDHVIIDPQFIRPADVELLKGDCRKAQRELDWKYSISFKDLIYEMVDTDLALLKT
jgi:GDPmannose 4,6-dehydratase